MKGKVMNEFIEKNKRLLKMYCLLAKFFGGILTFVGCIAVIGHSVALISRVGDPNSFLDYFVNVPWGMISFLPTGYLVLGLAQFIKYLLYDDYQPRWILGNMVKFLYLYAILLAAFLSIFCIIECNQNLDQGYKIAYHALPFVFYGGGKVLLLIGLGQVLRRIMPVIEESKTLV